jgi:hypothetical protein
VLIYALGISCDETHSLWTDQNIDSLLVEESPGVESESLFNCPAKSLAEA